MGRAGGRRSGAARVAGLLVPSLLVAGLAMAGLLDGLAPAPAAARPAAACTGTAGVTVVVDFGRLGGGVQIRCVTQTVTSGFDALGKAGFTYTPTVRFGGLLCRIDGKPADDPCVNTPPPDRYWAYWTAPAPGAAWTYSDTGAGNRVPAPGSVEGWAFSDGCDRRPGSGPCPTATTTTTRPRATTTTAPDRPGGDPGRTPPTIAGSGVTSAPGLTTTTTSPEGSPSTTAGEGRAPAAGAAGDDEALGLALEAASAADDATPDDGGGSPAGLLVGLLAAVAIVVGAVVTARRRSHEAGP